MGRIDKIKEQIGWLKVVFGILTAISVSLIGWTLTHYEKAGRVELSLALVAVAALTAAIVFVNRLAYRKIDELEDL